MREIFASAEEALQWICELHGFHVVEIGINTEQDSDARYCATLQYRNHIAGNGCSLGLGSTVVEALNRAFADAIDQRPVVRELIRDAA